MRHLLIFVLVVSLVGILMVPIASSQEATVPSWIKNNAGWWASDQIPDSAFLQGIKFLIKEGIMVIPYTETSGSSQSQEVPSWIKNTAGWWADDVISEVEFVNAIQYLIKHGIIIVSDGSLCVNDLSEIFGVSNVVVQNTCDLHESSVHTELVPFAESSNLNSLGFRGPEFSEIKPPNTYRIFMVGGSTMLGSGESSDETTIPGILQKIFDSNSSVQKIEVINAGMSGGTTNTEAHLIFEKLILFSPDLVITYDGWNDLKADYSVDDTAFYWQETCEIGRENNFDVIISLQPIVGFGDKKLTQQEAVNSFTGEDNYGYQLISAKSTYDYIGRELLSLQDDCNVVDLRGTFDDVSGPIYWDQGHVSDTANLILAEKFHEIVNEIIFNKKSNEGKFHSVISKYNSPIITSYLLSKIDIDVDYTQIKKMNLDAKDKRDGNYFYLKNQLGGSEKILVGKDLSKTDLSKINFMGQDLSGANLSGQDLRKIDFTGTILRGANLSFTNLSGQDLSGKDLRGINFHNANLENADLSNISLSKIIQYSGNPECYDSSSDFANTMATKRCVIKVLQNESVRTDFSNANMKGVEISISTPSMYFVDFSGADLTGIEFTELTLGGCKFNGANLKNISVSNVTFLLCEFDDVTDMSGSKFISVAYQDVSFRNAKIIDSYFESLLFIDVNFSNADLKGTTFSGELLTFGHNIFSCKNNQICDE